MAVATLATGVAWAYWSSSGTGSGAATAGTAAQVTFANGTPSSNLFPGGTADVAVLVANPNSYAVLITGLSAGTITSNNSTCTANGTGVSFNVPSSYPSSTYRVPANATSFPIHIAGGASMSVTSDNTCQGKTFTIPLSGIAAATS